MVKKIKQDYSINWNDKSNIIISILSFISFICYGYFACVLGASIPLISTKLNIKETSLGILFTARGFGFMFGTLLYTLYITYKFNYFRKQFIVSLSVFIAGIGSLILLISDNLYILMMIIFLQGFVYAGIDVIANILLPALWKDRVQPWLQALHACWSLGGIVGPAILGSIGYNGSNTILMLLCFIPMILLIFNDIIEDKQSSSSSDPNSNSNSGSTISFFNLKTIQYLFQLGKLSEIFKSKSTQFHEKKKYTKKKSNKKNNNQKNEDHSGNGDGIEDIDIEDDNDFNDDDEDDDDDDDYGIQIRPLQENNKINSSNYVPSSSSTSSSSAAVAVNYDFTSFSNHLTDIDYDGDGEEISSSSNNNPIHTNKSLSKSPPSSPSGILENSKNNDNNNNNNNSSEEKKELTEENPEEYWTLQNQTRFLLFLFYFIYVGLETGYGGWIPTYAVERKIAKNDAEGAYLASIFFFTISAGRLTAIPLASMYTPNFLIRIQLSIVIVGMILVVSIGTGIFGYTGLSIATGVLGYGISCIFPLGLSLTQDFRKLLMDERSISICMVGAVTGEATVPVLIGVAMKYCGVSAVLVSSFVISVGLVFIYITIYSSLAKDYSNRIEKQYLSKIEQKDEEND